MYINDEFCAVTPHHRIQLKSSFWVTGKSLDSFLKYFKGKAYWKWNLTDINFMLKLVCQESFVLSFLFWTESISVKCVDGEIQKD